MANAPRALVPLAEGFEDIEAVTVVDVLRRGGVEVVTASIHDSREVTSAHGIVLRSDALFDDVADDNLMKSEAVNDRLRRQKDEGRLICAICAAPTVLVEAGVLEPGQHVTCYPTCSVDLDRPCANVPVVADGNVITGQAPGAATLFALVVLQALSGEKVAQKVARGMVTDVL